MENNLEKNGVINFDEMPVKQGLPRFLEEIRKDKNGEITAYVMKRNPDYKE